MRSQQQSLTSVSYTHLDVYKRQHPQLKEMLQNILFAGVDFPFKRETPIIDLGVTFGFLKDKNGLLYTSLSLIDIESYQYPGTHRS